MPKGICCIFIPLIQWLGPNGVLISGPSYMTWGLQGICAASPYDFCLGIYTQHVMFAEALFGT